MRPARFHLVSAAICAALFAAVCLWQSPGLLTGRITPAELQAYLAVIETMPMPPEDRPEAVRRLRSWGESDDGRAFYMVNLMRYHADLRRYAGAPDSDMTPVQANQHYEDSVTPLVLERGAYPLAAGTVQGESVLAAAPDDDHWGRMIVVRYPSRRAFFQLLTDPAYLAYAPYKFMAMDVALVPADTGILWPEPRLLAGAILSMAFLGLGWMRSARRAGRP